MYTHTHTHRQHRDTLGDGGGWCAHPTSSFSLCLTYIKDGARTASTYPPRIPLNLKYPQYNSLMYIYVFCSSFLLDFSCLRLQMSSSNYIKFVTRCCWASLTYCINIDVQPWNEQMHLLTNYSWLPAVAEKKKKKHGRRGAGENLCTSWIHKKKQLGGFQSCCFGCRVWPETIQLCASILILWIISSTPQSSRQSCSVARQSSPALLWAAWLASHWHFLSSLTHTHTQ